MSTHPDITFLNQEAVPTPGGLVPTNMDRGFMVAVCERGDQVPQRARSLSAWEAIFGDAVSGGYGHVAAEAFFRLGGRELWTSPVFGPAAVAATKNLFDQSGSSAPADVALVATANSVGDWGNSLSIEVETGGVTSGYFVLKVYRDDVLVEASPELADRDAAVAWSASSDYVVITLGASAEDPRDAVAADLTGGDSDLDGVTEDEWTAALGLFTLNMGPGIVWMPGRTTTTAGTNLLQHGADFDRMPLLDAPNSGTVATVAAGGTAQRTAGDTCRQGGMFGPWVTVQGSTAGTTRTLPASALLAGLLAGAYARGESPGQAIAGTFGRVTTPWVLGLVQNDPDDAATTQWDDDDLNTLHSAGVNVIRRMYGTIMPMGFRTMADETTENQYVDLAGMNLLKAIRAQIRAMMLTQQFGRIDGKRHYFSKIENLARGILRTYYLADDLYGATEDEAFAVDAGDGVNTTDTIAAREAHLAFAIKSSPTAEQMVVSHVKVPTDGSVN